MKEEDKEEKKQLLSVFLLLIIIIISKFVYLNKYIINFRLFEKKVSNYIYFRTTTACLNKQKHDLLVVKFVAWLHQFNISN
jgi:hypothetical protein